MKDEKKGCWDEESGRKERMVRGGGEREKREKKPFFYSSKHCLDTQTNIVFMFRIDGPYQTQSATKN